MSNYEEAISKIEEARATGATELDLFNTQLTGLPPEIGRLTKLEWLYLSNTQLTGSCEVFENLKRNGVTVYN